MPLRRGLGKVDRLEEAGGNLALLQILCDAGRTALIVVGRMIRTLCIRAGAKTNRIFHEASISFLLV